MGTDCVRSRPAGTAGPTRFFRLRNRSVSPGRFATFQAVIPREKDGDHFEAGRYKCCGTPDAMNRRRFLKGFAALSTISALSASRVRGANERILVGLIGCGGRGQLVGRL